MDLESSRFSTADYSFHQDPPDNSCYYDNFNDNFPSTLDFTDTNYNSTLSLCTFQGDRAGGYYYPVDSPLAGLFFTLSTIEIEFDEGVPPPCEDLPTEFVCGESHPSIASIGFFTLRDTVLYSVSVNHKFLRYTKQLQEKDIE
jgi:hypothetical protein